VASVPERAADDLLDPDVIRAAQKGDPGAVEEFVARCLPLVYNVVGSALNGHGDVDEVVQEVMAETLDGLRGARNRDPSRLRSRLATTAVGQVRAWRQGQGQGQGHDAPGGPDAGPDFAELAIARLELSGQRREVVEATRWLDDLTDEERELLALWWQEAAGRLARADVVAAYDESAQHVESTVKRIRQNLNAARRAVRALGTTPGCEDLEGEVRSWDGRPSARWRERLARHVRGCPRCRLYTLDLVPAAHLLGGFPLVPPSAGLEALIRHRLAPAAAAATATATATADGAAGGGGADGDGDGVTGDTRVAGGRSRTFVVVAVAAAVAVAVTAGGVAAYLGARPTSQPERSPAALDSSSPPASPSASSSPRPSWPEATNQSPGMGAPPSRTPTRSEAASPTPSTSTSPTSTPTQADPSTPEPDDVTIPLGTYSLQLAAEPDRYLSQESGFAAIEEAESTDDGDAARDARFTVVPGLADSACHSFLNAEGEYLRHYQLRLQLDPDDGSELFQQDATFCPRPGAAEGTVTLESVNYPDHFLHARSDSQVWIDEGATGEDSSFRVVESLG
jgi:DNA-directed RNA polymerase specialized sigma24 family protein